MADAIKAICQPRVKTKGALNSLYQDCFGAWSLILILWISLKTTPERAGRLHRSESPPETSQRDVGTSIHEKAN
jgi:hypothetical protein